MEYARNGAYMGSRSFDTTPRGYADAYAYIQAIIGRGGRAEGDVAKVMSYFGRWCAYPLTARLSSLAFFICLWYNGVSYGKEE